MNTVRARVLVVDDGEGALSPAVNQALNRHEVDIARDVVEAIYLIDCATASFDLILCDLSRGDLTGPEIWAYLSLTRMNAARRVVFVVSEPLKPETLAFLEEVPNFCVELPRDAEALDTLAIVRASRTASHGPEAESA